MSTPPSTSTSHSDFVFVFNAALETYKRRTKKDLASDPLLPGLRSCESPDAILSVFRDQIPGFSQSLNVDDGFTKWVTPTVNVLYSFSATIFQRDGLVASQPASEIFAGIGVLLAAKGASAIQKKLIGNFNRIERFFQRLENYRGITPTTALKHKIVEIMVEVLTILAFATKEVNRGRLKRFFRKLIGNTDIEDSLQKLDKLTEEARMAFAELPKVTHSVEVAERGRVGNIRSPSRDAIRAENGAPETSPNRSELRGRGYDRGLISTIDAGIKGDSSSPQTAGPTAPYRIHNNEADSTLHSTFEATVADCPQIRILVLGKTGCGKSSLINKVFGVEKDDLAQVSHDLPGKCDINKEFRHPNNDRFILHDSEGFEPGQEEKLKAVKRFVAEQTQSEILPKDRLHVVWICISVPKANDRVIETGVQEVFEMVQKSRIPAIVIFTKYDKFVTTAIGAAGDSIADLDDEGTWQYGEAKASEAVESQCFRPWRETLGEVPLVMVSTRPRYKNTIQNLIEATDKEIPRREGVGSYTEAAPLNWASAQRGDTDIKFKASVDLGRKGYWSGLLSSEDFAQKKLQQCLDVIHHDIIAVWNIRDPNAYLMGDNFKLRMLVLVDDLVANSNTPTNGVKVVTAVRSPKWVSEVYQNTSRNLACVMGYIVNLTIVMHRLSAVDISEKSVVSALQDYAKSAEIAQVHNDIRTFCGSIPSSRLGDKDYTLDETIRLIEKHRVQVPRA